MFHSKISTQPTTNLQNFVKVPLINENKFPLCKNCKYFINPNPNPNLNANLNESTSISVSGYCKKTSTINVIDGSIDYISVKIAREMLCKGEYFIDNNTKTIKVFKEYKNNYNTDYKYFLE